MREIHHLPAMVPSEQSGRPGLRALLREDRGVNGGTTPGFHAVALHRIQQDVRCRPMLAKLILAIPLKLGAFYVRNLCSIEIGVGAELGRRVKIAHQGAIVISGYCVIGDDCLIRQGVTIGGVEDRNASLAPVLGNGVRIGAGAVVIGAIKIGDGASIGPNAVVTRHVQPGALVVAPPSRVLNPRE